jgi:hypothetical protein
MKKVVDSLGERLPPVKLYLDDIHNFFQILSEVSTDVKIETQGYEFKSVSDLKELDKDSIHAFKIYSSDPYISLDISSGSTIWLFTDKDLPAQRGVFEKMKKELIEKKRYSIPIIIYLILFTLIFNIALFFVPYIEIPLKYFPLIILFTFGISFFIGYIAYRILQSKKSIIFLDKKIDSPNFWNRNKDQLIVAVASSVVGAIIGTVITFLLI